MLRHELLTVVVPVYNEEATLRTSLDRLLATELPIRAEVIVVDDGSTDGGIATIDDLVAAGRVRLVSHGKNRGKGAAVRTGIAEASGSVLTILDGDLEYDPADYEALLQPLLAGETRIVYGTREFGSHTAYSFWYVIGNKAITFAGNLLFNTWLSDLETCFKMAETDLWRSLELRSDGFGIEAEATAKFLRSGARVFEVPIHYKARTREEGKKLRWTDGVLSLWILLRVRLAGR